MTLKKASQRRAIEWPTLMLAVAIYLGWAVLVRFHADVPVWLLVPAAAWLIAWHGSLQHETIHGHPTQFAWLNAVIGGLPLGLWLPYRRYRRDHIAHHATEQVTDPIADPESRYLSPATGSAGTVRTMLAALQGPLAGRLMFGPVDEIGRFFVSEVRCLRHTPVDFARDWVPHCVGLLFVGAWLAHCHMNIALYLAVFVYPGTALSLLRSFAEHRAARDPGQRIAVVERAGPFALLFLHNNLHAAHHRAPGLCWYRLPDYYRRHRVELLAENGGLCYDGYGEVARRFWHRPHDVLVHPQWQ